MATETTNDLPLEALIRSLDDVLKFAGVRPEDAETRFRLIHPLQRAIADRSECPPVSLDTPASRIVRLLWFKLHPERSDPDSVLGFLRDDEPLVRVTATEALLAALEQTQQFSSNPGLLRRTRTALTEQRDHEASPVIAHQIDRLLLEMGKLSRVRQATPASRRTNPYVAGPVIDRKDQFFGREETLRDIRNALGEQGGIKSIVIYGARRTGKTSLLYRIRDEALGDGFVTVFMDMQALAGQTVPGFLNALVEAIETATQSAVTPAVSRTELESRDMDLALFRSYIDAVIKRINPACLLLMFDEYEVLQDFIRYVIVARQFQSLLEGHRRLFFIFAGSVKVEALREKNFMLLLDNCKYMKISFLKPEEVRRLITEPSRGLLQFAEDVIHEIQELCAGHPFYTQFMCHSLFELAQGQGTVTAKHVEQAVQGFLDNPAPHLILGWNGLDLQEKVVASTLGEVQGGSDRWVGAADLVEHLRKVSYPIRVGLGEVQQTLGTLRELDWAYKKEGERLFRFSLDLVRRWVAEHRSIWEVLEEYHQGLLQRVARLGRRGAGATIDAVTILVVISVLVGTELVAAWVAPVVALVYYVLFLSSLAATPGMAMVRVRVLSEVGVRLPPWRSVLVGAFLSTPFVLVTASFPLFESSAPTSGGILLAVGIMVAFLHAARIHFSKSGRGLFDDVVHAVVVRR